MLAVADALEVEVATNDVITDTWKVFNAAATDQDYGVLLQVVAFAADVGPNFVAITEAYARHLTQSRVWLFRRFGGDANADAAFKRRWFFVVSGL